MRRSVGRKFMSDSDESDSSDSNRRSRGRRQTRDNYEEMNEAIQILQFENDEDDGSVDFIFNHNAFGNVLKQCKGLPIHIISIIGSFQTGRSLFLNLLKTRLEALEDNEATGNWLKTGKVLEGFEWKNSYNPVTKGIWIWGRPFILEGDEGKVAVLIMDTQGFHDEHTSPEEVSAILGITMMTSSTVILNLAGDLSVDIFTKLQPFLEYASIASENGVEDPPLPKLSFLIRDWKEPDIHAFGARGGSSYLQEKKQQLNRQLRQQIKDAFETLDCFLLPHIGEKALAECFTGSTEDLSEEFAQKIKLFLNKLTKDEMFTPKISLGSAITAEDFLQFTQGYVELYKKANQKQEMVDADDIYKVTREIHQDLIIKKCMAAYHQVFSAEEEKSRYLHKNMIDVTHAQAQAKASLVFKRSNVVKTFKKDFQKILEKQTKKAWEDFKEKHVSLRQNLVREAIENEANSYRENLEKKLPLLSDTHNAGEQKFYEDALIQTISNEAQKPAISRFRENFPEEEEENLGALTMSLENVLTSILEKFENKNESRKRHAEEILDALLQKLVESYKAKMTTQIERRNICDMAQLEQCHDLVFDSTMDRFDDAAKPGTEQCLQHFENKLKQLLISEMEEFKFQLEAKLDHEMGLAEDFVKTEVEKYEVKLQQKIEIEDADEDELQLFHKSFTADVLTSFEETSTFASNSPQDRKVRSRITDLLGSTYKKHVDEGVVARRKLEEKFQNILESSFTSYLEEMNAFTKEIHDSDQLADKQELETAHVDALQNALDSYDEKAKVIPDESGVMSQQQRSKLQEKIEQEYTNLLRDATRRMELAQTNAQTLVEESVNIYKDKIEANTTRLTSDEELKKRHDLLSREAYTNFMENTLVKNKEFLEKYLAQMRAEIAEIFNEMADVFSMTKRQDEQDIKEAVIVARTFYNDEMSKSLPDKTSLDPAKLHEIHGKVSKQALERSLAKNPKLTNIQKQNVEIALGKCYVKFKEGNEIRINSDKEPVIGIDLGTTYSCVGVYVGGEVKIIPNAHGNNTTPSYVAFEDDDSVTVGQAAKDTAFRNAEATIFDAKRMIGRKMDDKKLQDDMKFWPFNVIAAADGVPVVEVKGKNYHPEFISSVLLRHLKKEAEDFLNMPIKKAVITVPAYFNDGQRQATVDAGKMADLEVLTILNEPSAAAIAYKLQRFHDDPRCILVFDFGGGTFDVALVHMDGSNIKVKAVDGDTHLGGEDIDKNIMEHCAKEFLKASGKDLLKEKDTIAGRQRIRRLQTECENRKKDLSVPKKRSTEVALACMVDGIDLSVKITKKEFEDMNMGLFQKSIEIVDKVLLSAEVSKEMVDDIVLIGGTTRIPFLKDMLSNHFGGKALNSSINPDEAVAYGAAVQAAILNGKEEARQRYNLNGVHDVTPISLGIEIVGGALDVIIPKNTPIPTEHHESYRTHRDNQPNAHIKIYQGEILQDAKQNTLLGEFTLNGIPPAPKGEEQVDVRMFIDSMGILHVSATSKGSLESNSLQVDSRKDRLTEEKIEQYKEQGKKIRFIDCE